MDTKLFARSQPGGMFSIVDRQNFPAGNIWWVGSTVTAASDAAGFGKNPDAPFATLAYANAAAAEGDTILLMPGHVESLIAATTLTMSLAGLQVIGLGNGRLRPQITIDTAATATWNVSGANCLIENVDIISNFLNVAASLTVAATGDGLTLRRVNFYDTSVILGSLIGISIAAAVADVTIEQCNYYGIALTAAATSCIVCAGAADRLTIRNCYFKGEFSTGVITASAAKCLDVLFKDLLLINMSETGKGINLDATTTGAADNVAAYLEDDTANEKAITGAALFMTDRVRQTNAVGASTTLCIAADA